MTMEIPGNSRGLPKKQRGVTNMCRYRRFSVCLILWLFFVGGCSLAPHAQPALTTLNSPQGGTIVYGLVDGATTQAAAIGSVLRTVHNSCGEKPQVGKVFRVRGTNSDAVYYTVVDHPQGNRQAAGLVIASQTGPNKVEAAMVTDDAARFDSTINPMLTKLFSVWHPGGTTMNPDGSTGASSASASGAGGQTPAASGLHKVTLSDNTASVSIPDGWVVDPRSSGGTAMVTGTHGEQISLNNWFSALDPSGAQLYQRNGVTLPRYMIVYPANADLVKSFPDIFQRLRASNGLGPAPLQVDHIEQAAAPQGGHCVNVSGHMNPDGKGMQEMEAVLCSTSPAQGGLYNFIFSRSLLPNAVADQERGMMGAIMSSYDVNTALVQARSNAQMAPILASMRQNWQAQEQAMVAGNQQISNNIRQIGANATARMNATEAANDAQHASWNQGEDNISRNGQGFSNYLLDQSVVQNNNVGGNGTVGHATVWNSKADALVKSDPNRYEIVNTPNYWNGVDY